MEDKSLNMDLFDKILFTKVNFINALGLVMVAAFDLFTYVSEKATIATPIVTVLIGITVLAYNVIKTYRELFKKTDNENDDK